MRLADQLRRRAAAELRAADRARRAEKRAAQAARQHETKAAEYREAARIIEHATTKVGANGAHPDA